MASSPSTFAPDNVDKYFPSRDTSTLPSVMFKSKLNKYHKHFEMAINDRKSDDMKTTFAVSKEKVSASVKVTVLAVVVTIPMALRLSISHIFEIAY